jgi:hypothetical protein
VFSYSVQSLLRFVSCVLVFAGAKHPPCYLEMRLFGISALALAASVTAVKVTEHDKLAAVGLERLQRYVAENGSPEPGTCTLETASVRKEW